MKTTRYPLVISILFLLTTAPVAMAQLLWTVGRDDDAQTYETGGGESAAFVQEANGVNALPGSPFGQPVDLQADNDYYLAGDYSIVISGNGTYDPVGVVSVDEDAAERAVTPGDYLQRYHFNLPATMKPTDLLSVTWEPLTMETSGLTDPRYGMEVLVNNVKVQDLVVIRPAQLRIGVSTPAFSLAQVNAQVGPGYDNIVTLRGTDYQSDGGGRWMGFDYVKMTTVTEVIPQPVLPWRVGTDDNGWPVGNGGGTNATFVEGNGTVNALPGSPTSSEVAKGADNDYYFGGLYTNVIAGNGTYEPVGKVLLNEEAAERGFIGAETELRYHFNLPQTLQGSDRIAVTFDALNLDTVGTDPRYGVAIYFNGVLVMSNVVIRAADLNKPITSPAFTLSTVGARTGLGQDNIISLRGTSYKDQGGGDSLGLDYIQLKYVPPPIVMAPMPWSVGKNDNTHIRDGNGGGPNTSFMQENGFQNPLPGVPNSPETDKLADNDYYFAGVYTNVIASNGSYTPVGDVQNNEEAAERAFVPGDQELRYHFNLPTWLTATNQLVAIVDPLDLDTSPENSDPRWGIEIYLNNVLVQTQLVIRADQLNVPIYTEPFTLAKVNAQTGFGADNILSLKGISYNGDGGGAWMGIDYLQLSPVLPPPFPWSVGKDDNGHRVGDGGGPNATFVQEGGGDTLLPGSPISPEMDQRADNDYYFAGEYTKTIPSVVAAEGDYTPVGKVLLNEEAAERAFYRTDNNKRYHFNLPSTLKPTDQIMVTADFVDLDGGGGSPQYGFEVYVNDVLVQPEIIVFPADLDRSFTTPPFTLASVNAGAGPGWDNIVMLKGVPHDADGGGTWMGIDYVQVNTPPQPVFPWSVGADDNSYGSGDGGGPNTTFVQETGTQNDLPGRAKNREIDQQADNDYYFAGGYTNVIPANGSYVPVGWVPFNEEAAERAFAGNDLELRYHFNLPTTLKGTDKVEVTFEPLSLQTDTPSDPRFGVEVYVNNTLVMPEKIIRTNDLFKAVTTPAFTLASVNAQVGVGYDNIVALKGINYNGDGGGNWMGFDYVKMDPEGAGVPLKFTSSTVKSGKITLTWTGTGTLQWSTSLVGGTWTAVTPTPTSPYSEDILPNQVTRFYRLQKP